MLLPKLEAEISDLDSKLKRLKEFMDCGSIWDNLSEKHQDLLIEQEEHMLGYVNVLYARKALLMGDDIS